MLSVLSLSAACVLSISTAAEIPGALSHFKVNGNGEDACRNSPAIEVSSFALTNGTIHLTDGGYFTGRYSGETNTR